jgi:multidrug resistance efflux pump
MLAAFSACRSSGEDEVDRRGVVIVNAPAAGEVRRVFVREGMTIEKDAPVVEIAVRAEGQSTTRKEAEDPQTKAIGSIKSAEAEIEAARAEVVRTEIEVQRLASLVASDQAPPAQLEGARADYERAQQRLQRAQAAAKEAQDSLVAARQPSRNQSPAATGPVEQLVTARASSAGTVSAVSARVGERVTSGQPLATLRAEPR